MAAPKQYTPYVDKPVDIVDNYSLITLFSVDNVDNYSLITSESVDIVDNSVDIWG